MRLNILTKKQLYKLLLMLIVISGSLGIIALLIMFNSAMSRSLNQIEGYMDNFNSYINQNLYHISNDYIYVPPMV